MNLIDLENTILSNKGNQVKIGEVIKCLKDEKTKLDWQMEKFLSEHCNGVMALKQTNLDTTNPIYRYYNYKCEQYFSVERLLRVAKAYL